MIAIKGNIWDHHSDGYVVVTTNGSLDCKGKAVMDRSTALQARNFFPDLPLDLGRAVRKHGNKVYIFHKYRIVTFPTKSDHWKSDDTTLVLSGLKQLMEIWVYGQIYIPKLECLDWTEIQPLIERYLPEAVIVDFN